MRKPVVIGYFSRILVSSLWITGLISVSPLCSAEVVSGLPTCAVCKKPIKVKGWRYGDVLVCDACHHLPAKCSICGLPALEGYSTTSDGRVICAADAPNVVLDLELARQIFQDTREDLLRLTKGRLQLRYPHVNVNLFDVDYWNHQNGQMVNGMHKTGFSQSRIIGERYIHSVLLLSGQRKLSTASVCAHEYMHLWINENLDRSRNVEPNTIESICELIAYELMSDRGMVAEMETIQTNPYTNGRILTALDFRDRLGLDAVLDWIKNGNGSILDGGELVKARDEAILASMRALPRHKQTAAPEKLTLKGLSGSKEHRFALINNRTFEKGEHGAVQVGTRKVRVVCLDIREDSVVIQMEGGKEPLTLSLTK